MGCFIPGKETDDRVIESRSPEQATRSLNRISRYATKRKTPETGGGVTRAVTDQRVSGSMHSIPLHSSLWPLLSLFLANALTVDARVVHSLPEDPFAFPKYRVTFLNGLPLQNDTAERWINDGLRGGELEFLDQPWHEVHWDGSRPLKEIGSGQTGAESQVCTSTPSCTSWPPTYIP